MENIRTNIHEDFENLKQNKEEYFKSFYSNNYNLVYRICFSILKNKENSEDVAQTVFEKIYKLPNEKIASSYESTWLYTVAKNESIQFIRKNKFNLPLDEQLNNIFDEKNEIDDVVESEEYQNLVKKLDKKQEQIVSLKVLSNFTFKEIGEILSMPTTTVQWHYYKSIKYLRVAMANFAMFILAFIIGIRYMYKIDDTTSNKSIIQDDNLNQDEAKGNVFSIESVDITSQIEESSSDNKSVYENVESSLGVSTDGYTASSNNVVSIGIFSLAGIFLVITIIFSIVCIKHKKNKNK